MKNRIFALCLSCLMLLTVFAACGKTDTPDTPTPASGTAEPGESTAAPDTEPVQTWRPDEMHDITDTFDLDGRAIGIIYQDNHGDFASMLGSDDADASMMQLEMHYRDTYLMDALNITYKETSFFYDDLTAGTEGLLMSGDLSWDLAHWNTFRLFGGGIYGLLYDLNTLPYVDQTKAYWASNVQESLSIAGHQFMGINDYNTDRFSGCCCIIFNRQLIEDNHMDDPYDLVQNGEWTFDRLLSMSSAALRDVNGDGKYTVDESGDVFGFAMHEQNVMLSFYNATGNTFITHDEDDYPVFNLTGNETAQTVWDWLSDNFKKDPSVVIHTGAQPSFVKDELLFNAVVFGELNGLRDMESDFGVLPYPKLNAEQTEYYTCGGYSIGGLGVIFATEIPREIGAFLELGSCYGHQNLIPRFYDNDLKKKISRDPQTSRMFDLIMNGAVYDMARLGFWAETDPVYGDGFTNGGNLASLLAAHEKKINRVLSDAVEDYLDALKYQ